ncbi:myelin-oligodendrocyte glycoprotein-like [Morone saxatilis]|uniref:myelin-oligodendrocyte glycoprotein-like n=1 Tax=Morone saxatilis TaxID=34816 RepID=UPI0015E2427D|nr:myelin-oligodendrocyte glycoprotein-like [Morone saxatilis]
MIHLKKGPSFEPQMSLFHVLVVNVVVLFMTSFCTGQSPMIGPHQPIVALVGDDIILPCHLEPAVDAVSMTVEWARADLSPRFVHLRRDGVELLTDQNPSYLGRTSVSINKLKHGDLSLTLSKVKLSDEGSYKCFIPTEGTEYIVKLVVGTKWHQDDETDVGERETISKSGAELQFLDEGKINEREVEVLNKKIGEMSEESQKIEVELKDVKEAVKYFNRQTKNIHTNESPFLADRQ